MPRKPKALVLDSWAVIAYLEDEPSGQQIADLIAGANEERIPVYMCVVNAGEVWYIIAREIS
ncbi:MAG: type II toxin-antitoxin system VapC family toxin, partial [Anaerolineales bacterium]